MKKIFLWFIVIICFGVIALMAKPFCSAVFGKNSEKRIYPEFSCSYTEFINKLKTCEWDVDVQVEAPQWSKGFWSTPDYSTGIKLSLKDGVMTHTMLDHSARVDVLFDWEIRSEVYDLLSEFEAQSNVLEAGKTFSQYVIMLADNADYRFVSINDFERDSTNKRLEKDHIALLCIYRLSTKEVLYLSEVHLNGDYCFPHTESYIIVNDFKVVQ